MIFQGLRKIFSHYRPCLVVAKRFSHPRKVLLSAGAMSSYDWEKEKFSDQELVKYFQDIDFCSNLKLKTLTCEACGLRIKIDIVLPEIPYCKCSSSKPGSSDQLSGGGGGWVPYVERKDILVWRKEHAQKKGLYHYKLYGVFDDITVWEFLAVQLDLTKFRLGWDSSTAQCKQLDVQTKEISDRQNTGTTVEDETSPSYEGVSNSPTLVLSNGCDTNGEDASEAMVYYWEVHWPTFFSNRDYCCLRQHLTDPTGRMVISSRTTRHAGCPTAKKNWRVQDYQSVMAVRPTNHPDKPGVEFSLTAFEDPGVALPESIISFVAVRTMPEFMTNLRAACLKLRGAVASAELPKPELFRRDALLRDEGLFEHPGEDVDAVEESVSKGDAAYESAWIDKLLKDSDESGSEAEENPVVARKSSLEFEAESIRKDPVAVFLEPKSTGDPSFKYSNKAKNKTSNDSIASEPLDDNTDQLDAENNKFQVETLNLYKSHRKSAQKKPQDRTEASNLSNLNDLKDSPMDGNTLKPFAVNDEITKPNPDNCNPTAHKSPVSSQTRHNLLFDEETVIPSLGNSCEPNLEPMSISSGSDQSSPEKVSSNSFLLASEQILSSSGYIEHEMELLLYEEKEISSQSTLLEHRLREVEGAGKECEDLLQLWFNFVSRKNVAFHRRLMLEILQSEQDLERRCELLQGEVRRGGRGEVAEKLLLEELVKVVDLRDELVMARDREENSLQEGVVMGRQVNTKLQTQDIKTEKCKLQ